MEGEGSEKMTVMAAKEKSSFAVTCGLLSRYLREKKGGALQGLDMATAVGGGKLSRVHLKLDCFACVGLVSCSPNCLLIEMYTAVHLCRSFPAADHHELVVGARGAKAKHRRRGALRR